MDFGVLDCFLVYYYHPQKQYAVCVLLFLCVWVGGFASDILSDILSDIFYIIFCNWLIGSNFRATSRETSWATFYFIERHSRATFLSSFPSDPVICSFRRATSFFLERHFLCRFSPDSAICSFCRGPAFISRRPFARDKLRDNFYDLVIASFRRGPLFYK